MNIKNISKLALVAITFVLHDYCIRAQPSTENTPSNHIDEQQFDALLQTTPLQFSMNSIKHYFNIHQLPLRSIHTVDGTPSTSNDAFFSCNFSKYIGEVYNKQNYATMLSQDGSHLVDFLELSNELNLNQTTVYVGLRLFHNKFKDWKCEIVDDTVLLQIIEPLGKHLERYFTEQEQTPKTNLSFIRKHTEDLMLAKFTDHYAVFQQEPDVFLSSLSDEITKQFKSEFTQLETSMQEQQEKAEMRERLRSMTVRFLETLLSKTMWNTQSYEGIWDSFQAIAYGLQSLGAHSVISHMDDLDSLLWSHVHRFCYFLDLVGSHLPLEFYEEVETDLNNNMIYFLEDKEQDACIKTKKETLSDSLASGRMKAFAFTRGIVDHMA